jgi:protein dithiol oxidoreductase (disulfide-forming)
VKTFKLWTLVTALMVGLTACGNPDQPATPNPASVAADSSPVDTTAPAPVSTADAPPARVDLAQAEQDGPAAGVSERFELGRHYRRLSPAQPTSSPADQVEVAEVFWYGCPHCYTFDPYVESWLTSKPDYISFVRIPAVWNPLLQLHARAYYTAEALGKIEEMHTPLFRELHVNRNPLNTEERLLEFFAQFGVEAEAFQSAFNSFSVNLKMQRADELAKRYRISSVPAVVINGKYITDATSAGSYEALMELINELAASEAEGA